MKQKAKPGPESKKDKPASRFREKALAQEEAATMLADGATRNEAADRVGRSKGTIDGWLETASFQALVETKRLEGIDVSAVNSKTLIVLETALDIILENLKVLKKGKASAGKLKAALETVRITAMKLPISGTKANISSPSPSFDDTSSVIEFVGLDKEKKGEKKKQKT